MDRKLINKKEILLIVPILLACVVIFLYYGGKQDEKIAKITVNGQIYQEINLTRNKDEYMLDIPSNGKTAHIKVSGNTIGFIDHECPDGICENAGMMSSPLQTAVCLPLKVSVTISSNTSALDAVAG